MRVGSLLWLLVIALCSVLVAVHAQDVSVGADGSVVSNDVSSGHRVRHRELAAEHDHEFLKYVSAGDVDRVRDILTEDANVLVEAQTSMGWNALIFAAVNGDLLMIDELLQHGADVNSPEHDGWTPLMFVSFTGDIDTVKHLLSHGAHPTWVNNAGMTPIDLANIGEHLSIVKLLREQALMDAIGRGESAIPEALEWIRDGVNVNTQNDRGFTALTVAALHGDYEAVEELVWQRGADVNLAENDGWTPLMFAANNDREKIASFLLENNAKPELVGKDGANALSMSRFKSLAGMFNILLNFMRAHNITPPPHPQPKWVFADEQEVTLKEGDAASETSSDAPSEPIDRPVHEV